MSQFSTEKSGSSTPLLSVQNLSIDYPDASGRGWTRAVRDIGFDLPACGALALVGESGSGKSSTAMAVGRLSDLQFARLTGRILYEGRDVTRMNAGDLESLRRSELAYVFQEPMATLNPVLRIRAQIAESLPAEAANVRSPKGSRDSVESRVRRCLEEARVPTQDSARVAEAFPHELSGGLQQRVMIAMALAKNARLLIADEPTTALDAAVQKEILLTLRGLRRTRGLAILFVTHDLQAARAVADTILVMQNGMIVDSLSRDGRFEPHHPYSKRLMTASLFNQPPKTRIAVD